MEAPDRFETRRLVLRRPRRQDAEAILARYAGDTDITRLLGWRRHESVDATRAFLEYSNAEWEQWPAGPYLVESREDGSLLGSTGFGFETPHRPSGDGLCVRKRRLGQGLCDRSIEGPRRCCQQCRPCPTVRPVPYREQRLVAGLEKCGFSREGVLRRHSVFPNLDTDEPCDVFCYAVVTKRRP